MGPRGSSTGWRLLAGSCVAALATLSQPAMAQSADAKKPAKAGSGMDEIVVTARFVKENIQDTPIAITAQTGAQLESANVTNISSLGAVVPNLQTVPGDSQSAGTPRISLRGVQQGASSSIAVPPAVAIYTDDIYHSTTAGSELDFTDVVRVEVNRGPQSTLSGNRIHRRFGQDFSRKTPRATARLPQHRFWQPQPYRHVRRDGHQARADLVAAGARPFRQAGRLWQSPRLHLRNDQARHAGAGWKNPWPADGGWQRLRRRPHGRGETAIGQAKLLWEPTDKINLLLTARYREENSEETSESRWTIPSLACAPSLEYPAGHRPAAVQCGGRDASLSPGDVQYVWRSAWHAVRNAGAQTRHLRHLRHQLAARCSTKPALSAHRPFPPAIPTASAMRRKKPRGTPCCRRS